MANLKRAETKERLLAAAAVHGAIEDAARSMSVSPALLEALTQEDPQWAQRLAAVAAFDPFAATPEPFAAFRLRCFDHTTPEHHKRMIRAMEAAKADSITLILAFPEAAKGLALDTPLPTPSGWTTMGELFPGDELFDEHGDVCRVVAVSPIHDRPCFRLTFAGGESIVSDDEHLWMTRSMSHGRKNRRVLSSAELAVRPHAPGGNGTTRPDHAVPMVDPLVLPEVDLPIDPYVLGTWLGDGTSTGGAITVAIEDAAELLANLELAGEQTILANKPRSTSAVRLTCSGLNPLQSRLRRLGLLNNKNIPPAYLRASFKQRLALLQGLCDTDGSVDKRGRASFVTTSPALRDGMAELLSSLGMKFGFGESRATLYGKDCGPVYRFSFNPRRGVEPFRMTRKLARLRPDPPNDRRDWRVITDIESVERVPTRCIAVDSPSKLFLCGRSMVPTHNSSLLADYICWKLAFNPNFRVASISEGQDLARKLLNQVSTRMTDEFVAPEYLRSFGPFQSPDRSKPWNADFIQVLRARHDEKEPSYEARGAGSTLYGGRYDLLVPDDIQSDRNLEATNKLLRYIRQTVLTRPAKGKGRTVFVGSRVGVGDVYHRMHDEGMVDNAVTIPALSQPVTVDEHYIVTKHKGVKTIEVNPDCPAVSTWPEYWTLLDFARRRAKVGEEVWARTYMQQQVAPGGAVFGSDEVESAKDLTRGLGRNSLGVDCILTVDPAFDSGVCAFMVLAWSSDNIWIVDGRERKDIHRYEDIYEQVGQFAMRYRPSTVIVEQNNFQKGLHQDDRMRALSAKFGFDLVAHQTSRKKNDPVIGVKMMASAFIDHEISLPWGDEDARAAFQPLVDQLLTWRPMSKVKQDSVMALWFGWLWWEAQRHVAPEAPSFRRPPSWASRSMLAARRAV